MASERFDGVAGYLRAGFRESPDPRPIVFKEHDGCSTRKGDVISRNPCDPHGIELSRQVNLYPGAKRVGRIARVQQDGFLRWFRKCMEASKLFYRTGKSILHSREPFNKISTAHIPPHFHALEFSGNGRPGEEVSSVREIPLPQFRTRSRSCSAYLAACSSIGRRSPRTPGV